MNFIKENYNLIVKMFGFQLVMAVFGLLLMAASVVNDNLILITSLFATGFYMVLLYVTVWEVGGKDKIKIDGGRLRFQPAKGLIAAFFAAIPNLLLGIFATVGYYSMDLITLEPVWAANLYGVCNAISRLLNGSYLGIIQTLAPNNPLMLIAVCFPAVLASGLAYLTGVKNISVSALLGFKKDESKR